MSESRHLTRDSTPDRTEPADRSLREALVSVDASEFDTIGIEELVSSWRDAGLRGFETLACNETGAVVQVTVERPLDVDLLDDLECVDRWERVWQARGARRYVIEFTAPKFPPSLAGQVDELIDTCDPDVTERGLTVSLVGTQQAISEVVSEYEAVGLSPDLRKFGPYDGREAPLDSLTDRQREVLETAYEMGYYEVPREVSSRDIAAELTIDASTVSEHLQRAERNVLARQLSAPQ